MNVLPLFSYFLFHYLSSALAIISSTCEMHPISCS
jgi:hypothetical protein